jgi:CheY-like chemotaxis protein
MKKIIIAEDDPSIQDSIKLILERSGYDITIYPHGEPLLENDYELPDLFILDKQLSGVDGLDICSYLKQQPATKDIPVVMISASPHIARLAKQAGADDFVEKPFKMHELRQIIARHLKEQAEQ